MNVGSLFSGIGGLDLGLERAGMRVVWQAEIQPYAAAVLARHWPGVPNLGDVTAIDWDQVERPDLVCGGFPCQPVSVAGLRRGSDDERWLWPEVHRAVRHLRPRFVLLENVPGLLDGWLGPVLGDLAASGYDTEWDCLPAAAFGAPHLRDRVFVVAYAQHPGHQDEPRPRPADTDGPSARPLRPGADVADAHRSGRIEQRGPGAVFAEQPAVERFGWWCVEPPVGRMADGISHRVDRLRSLGNSVVPQVAEWIGRRLMTEHFDGQVEP